ncbi:cation:proton antiporter [Ottowia testudinis]|uniref:Cation:proton antiporter n=1 Tax=Ottowia testudinis TaxID=2816950 RepID=A0A975H217_9BURK|nr:cation:proton antiporter [Ottowia testudinis]QTD43695.1 cation:proton antiporter [Ottowia testudinis]
MSVGAAAQEIGVHKAEAVLFFTLLQLTVVVLAGRIGSTLAARFGQSTAVGEIIVGILLGPSLFGLLAPGAFNYVFHSAPGEPMQVLSQIGLILLMFQIGLEFDFGHLTERRNRRAVMWVSAAGLLLPFVLGGALGWFIAPFLGGPNAAALATALFVATAFSITALPILGRILIEFDMTQRPLGVIAISAAAINDVVGWLLLALVTTLSVSQFQAGGFALNVGAVGLFAALSWWGLRPLLKRLVGWAQRQTPRDGEPQALPNNLLGVLLAAIFIGAMTTYQLGIFAIFGGFMLGVLLHDERALADAWRDRMGQFVTVFFLPIFFTYTGLRTNIGSLDTPVLWGWCALVIGLATVGKFCGSYLAARFVGLPKAESKVLGILMNTRALMELIVINVGYDLGVISQNLFTMLVLMAIFSTVVTSPLLRRWLPRCAPES